MRAALLIANIILILLVTILVAHLWQAPKRWQAVESAQRDGNQSVERLQQAVDRLADEGDADADFDSRFAKLAAQQAEILRRLQEGVRLSDSGSTTDKQTQVIAQPPAGDRDGKAALGKRFLLPYDGSHFDAAKIGGTWKTFAGSPKGLNNVLENSSTVSNINALVNDGLCTKDMVDTELWRSELATDVLIEDDWKRYTFTIRKGVTWQVPRLAWEDEAFAWLRQPVPLTAHDFVFYLEMITDPQTECPALKAYYGDLDKVEAIDDHTLVVTWKERNYTNITFTLGLSPLPRHVYTANEDGSPIPAADIGIRFNKHWFDQRHQLIGVGRYLIDLFEFDNRIRFKRNTDYWGKGLHFEFIDHDLVTKDPTAQLTAFKNGQVHEHVLPAIQFKTNVLDHAEKRFAPYDPDNLKAGRAGELGWEKVISKSYSHIGWNMRRPLFSDKRVRQAMSHAFPKQRIIREVYHNLGRSQITVVHPDSPYNNTDLPDYDYDVEKARTLLLKAGWEDTDGDGLIDKVINGERVPFAFIIKHYDNSPEWTGTLSIFRAELKKLGIDMKPQSLRWPDLVKVYEDQDFDAVSGGWRLGGEVDFFQLWHSSKADELRSSNYCGFKNDRADELALELRRSFDLDERIRIAKEFQAILHEEQPYTWFRSTQAVFIWQNSGPHRLSGVEYALDQYHPFNATSSAHWHLDGP